jgi:hypothetical protein
MAGHASTMIGEMGIGWQELAQIKGQGCTQSMWLVPKCDEETRKDTHGFIGQYIAYFSSLL